MKSLVFLNYLVITSKRVKAAPVEAQLVDPWPQPVESKILKVKVLKIYTSYCGSLSLRGRAPTGPPVHGPKGLALKFKNGAVWPVPLAVHPHPQQLLKVSLVGHVVGSLI